ncbi:hypothetical protein CXF72_14025 [Psychromonas sp. MB-3u-54]|nr:hypothetical protein CXF72_14025 [Psychromonas sp. MB-3u-54]
MITCFKGKIDAHKSVRINLISIAKEKLALIRRELREIVLLTSKLTTQLGGILTSKGDHLCWLFWY